ncbi:hypothetical protein [Streptomyces sp. NBC_00035]|uniref:hypothetical protein n=1 Tax=Streptomyces sp. NBC_00035 TaxID=2903614 RepID=UPI003255BB4E
MSAPATHRPSPADLARRTPQATTAAPPKPAPGPAPTAPRAAARPQPPKLSAAEAIAPGRLADGERFKPSYHRGLLLSGMLPEARLMGYTLLWYANHSTGRISPNFQPGIEELVEHTGLDARRVGVQLEVLRERGWLRLATIQQGPRAGLPRFELTIPALYLERVRAHRARQIPSG